MKELPKNMVVYKINDSFSAIFEDSNDKETIEFLKENSLEGSFYQSNNIDMPRLYVFEASSLPKDLKIKEKLNDNIISEYSVLCMLLQTKASLVFKAETKNSLEIGKNEGKKYGGLFY